MELQYIHLTCRSLSGTLYKKIHYFTYLITKSGQYKKVNNKNARFAHELKFYEGIMI